MGHVQFKIAVFQCTYPTTHRCIRQTTHVSSSAITGVSTRRLRSTDTAMCAVRRSHNTFDYRCFTTAGPHLWNSLTSIQCDSLGEFKRLLKTHLLGTTALCDIG